MSLLSTSLESPCFCLRWLHRRSGGETPSPEIPLPREHSDPELPHLSLGSFSLSVLLKDPGFWTSWTFLSFRSPSYQKPRAEGQGLHPSMSWSTSCYWPCARRPRGSCTSPVGREGRSVSWRDQRQLSKLNTRTGIWNWISPW